MAHTSHRKGYRHPTRSITATGPTFVRLCMHSLSPHLSPYTAAVYCSRLASRFPSRHQHEILMMRTYVPLQLVFGIEQLCITSSLAPALGYYLFSKYPSLQAPYVAFLPGQSCTQHDAQKGSDSNNASLDNASHMPKPCSRLSSLAYTNIHIRLSL